jgi:hypothetical protein
VRYYAPRGVASNLCFRAFPEHVRAKQVHRLFIPRGAGDLARGLYSIVGPARWLCRQSAPRAGALSNAPGTESAMQRPLILQASSSDKNTLFVWHCLPGQLLSRHVAVTSKWMGIRIGSSRPVERMFGRSGRQHPSWPSGSFPGRRHNGGRSCGLSRRCPL